MGVGKQIVLFLFFITTFCIGTAQTLPSIGVRTFKPNLSDPSYRLYFTDELETAHLINREGRYLHTWSYPQGIGWKYVEMLPSGHLRVLLENKQVIDIDWDNKIVKNRSRILNFPFAKRAKKLVQNLPNGNAMLADWKNGRLVEMTPRGKLVWEYMNPDFDRKGQRMRTNRIVTVSPQVADPLLASFGVPTDIPLQAMEIPTEVPSIDMTYTYLLPDIMAKIETGYLDEAFKIIRQLLQDYPNDPEYLYIRSLIYGQRRDIQKAIKSLIDANKAGFPLERFTLGDSIVSAPLTSSEAFTYFLAQNAAKTVVHGPILGNVHDDFADIWLRTDGAAVVSIKVKPIDSDKVISQTASYKTTDSTAFIHTLRISKLSPNTSYRYEVWVDNRKLEETYSFKTYPGKYKRTRFQIGFSGGSSFNPTWEHMWDTLSTHQLSALLLLGNQVYINHPLHTATQLYCYHRRQSQLAFRKSVSTIPTYSIWGAHDFASVGVGGGPDTTLPYWKRNVWQLFNRQWNNPPNGDELSYPGCYHSFSIGDVDFFMLDDRYYRDTIATKDASILGKRQKSWLFRELKNSSATFKVIATSVPWAPNSNPNSPDSWDSFSKEREEIFAYLDTHQIEGVLLLSGGTKRSDAWRISRPDSYTLYEFSSGRFTLSETDPVLPAALLGYNKSPSFGLLEFDTTQEDPSVTYRIMNADNREIHRVTVYKSDLKKER